MGENQLQSPNNAQSSSNFKTEIVKPSTKGTAVSNHNMTESVPLNELETNIHNLQYLIDNLSNAHAKQQQPFSIRVDDEKKDGQFMQHLYCPKPTMHQINTMDNPKERLNLFRFLQMREGFKFQ